MSKKISAEECIEGIRKILDDKDYARDQEHMRVADISDLIAVYERQDEPSASFVLQGAK